MSCTMKFKEGKCCGGSGPGFARFLVRENGEEVGKGVNWELTRASAMDTWPLPPPMSTTVPFFNDSQRKASCSWLTSRSAAFEGIRT